MSIEPNYNRKARTNTRIELEPNRSRRYKEAEANRKPAAWAPITSSDLQLYQCRVVAHALSFFVFAYNFYVYLITGKQFRSELRKLFSSCRCRSSSSVANNAARIAGNRQADAAV